MVKEEYRHAFRCDKYYRFGSIGGVGFTAYVSKVNTLRMNHFNFDGLKMKRLIIALISTFLINGMANARSPEYTEANALGMKYMSNAFFYGCKEKVFIFKHSTNLTSVQTHIFQVIDPRITVYEESKVTEIDRLNGLEWKGGARLNFKAIRTLLSNGSWREWSQRASGFTMLMEKRQGKWEVGGSWDGYFENAESCADNSFLREMAVSPPLASQPSPNQAVKNSQLITDVKESIVDEQQPSLNCAKPTNFIENVLCKAMQGSR